MIDLDKITAENEIRRAAQQKTHDAFWLAEYFVADNAPDNAQ